MATDDRQKRNISNVSFVRHDWIGSDLATLPDRHSDLIYAHFFLHLFGKDEWQIVLDNVVASLRPGGRVLVSVASCKDSKFGQGHEIEPGTYACYPDRPWHFLHFFGAPELSYICERAGLTVRSVEEYQEVEWIAGRTERTASLIVTAQRPA